MTEGARPVPGYLPTTQELAWLRRHKEPTIPCLARLLGLPAGDPGHVRTVQRMAANRRRHRDLARILSHKKVRNPTARLAIRSMTCNYTSSPDRI